MDFFSTKNFNLAGIAQQVASQVEKRIDKVLDITETEQKQQQPPPTLTRWSEPEANDNMDENENENETFNQSDTNDDNMYDNTQEDTLNGHHQNQNVEELQEQDLNRNEIETRTETEKPIGEVSPNQLNGDDDFFSSFLGNEGTPKPGSNIKNLKTSKIQKPKESQLRKSSNENLNEKENKKVPIQKKPSLKIQHQPTTKIQDDDENQGEAIEQKMDNNNEKIHKTESTDVEKENDSPIHNEEAHDFDLNGSIPNSLNTSTTLGGEDDHQLESNSSLNNQPLESIEVENQKNHIHTLENDVNEYIHLEAQKSTDETHFKGYLENENTLALNGNSKEMEKILEKLTQRERQLMTLTEENSSLNDMIQNLRGQGVDQLTKKNQELSQKLQTSQKDREQLRTKLKTQTTEFEAILKQKDDELNELKGDIDSLRVEGEKLSLEQGKDRKKIKEYKTKETNLNKEKGELASQLEQANKKIESLTLDLKAAERYKESGLKVQEISENYAKRISELESQLREANLRETTLKTSLERAYKEISDARKENLETLNKAHSDALDKEILKNEEIHRQFEEYKRQSEDKLASALRELAELRASNMRIEDQAGWREDNLRKELVNIQTRLQLAEARNDELISTAQETTQPLSRQIEALQNQIFINSKNFTQIENSLTEQVKQAKIESAESLEKERLLQTRVSELSVTISTLETQISGERQNKANLAAALEAERKRVSTFEEKYNEIFAKLENERIQNSKNLEEVKDGYQKLLRRQLEEEKSHWEKKLDEEKKKVKELSEREKPVPLIIPSPVQEKSQFPNENPTNLSAFDSIHYNLDVTGSTPNSPSQMSNTGLIIEKLNTVIRRKDQEIESLREQFADLTKTRDGLIDELLKESAQKEKLAKDAAELIELSHKHHTALELLGEKTEEVEELRNDLQDVKQIFREQVTEMLDRIEVLTKALEMQSNK